MGNQYDQSVPFQRRVVAAAWQDPKRLRDHEVYNPDFFTDEVLGGVLRTLQKLQQETGNVPDLPGVSEACRTEVAPGRTWAEYAEEAKRVWSKTKGDLAHYAGAAAEFARHRAVAKAVEEAHECVQAGDLDSIEGVIRRALRVGSAGGAAVNLFETSAERFGEYVAARERGIQSRVPTGLGPIDREIRGGVGVGELACLFGLTGTGKSHTLVDIDVRAALAGRNVLHVSLENSLEITQARLDCRLLEMPYEVLAKKPKTFRLKFQELRDKLKSRILVSFFPPDTLTVSKLEALIESADPRPELVVVDYAALLVSPTKSEELRHRLHGTFTGLRGVAGRTGTAMWTAHQASFDGLGARLLGPEHSSECRSLVHVIDYGASLNVDETKPALAVVYLFKNRNGKDKFTVNCEIDWSISKITPLLQE